VAARLAALRGGQPADRHVGLDSALVALSGRVRVREGAGRSAEDVITELWQAVFGPDGDPGKGDAPEGATATSPTS
jgi:MoxR-like ATPase